jgi:hypothetical protein
MCVHNTRQFEVNTDSIIQLFRFDALALTKILKVAAQIVSDSNKSVSLHQSLLKLRLSFQHMLHILTCGIWALVLMAALV